MTLCHQIPDLHSRATRNGKPLFQGPVAKVIKHFAAVITPLAAYFSMILTELHRYQCNYNRRKFYNIGQCYKTFYGGNYVAMSVTQSKS